MKTSYLTACLWCVGGAAVRSEQVRQRGFPEMAGKLDTQLGRPVYKCNLIVKHITK